MSDLRAGVRLLRAGSVPDAGIGDLTVGADELIALATSSMSRLAKHGIATPLFINGEWGSGKTHSLRVIRSLAIERGHAAAEAVFNARTCPPSHPQRMMPIMTRSLALGEERGIRSIMRALLRDEKRSAVAIAKSPDKVHADIFQAAQTLQGLARREETALFGTSQAWRILAGSDIAASDYGYRREKALTRLDWMARFLHLNGAAGTVLLLDELETIGQLWNRRSRATAYDVLGALVETPRTWCVFGVTERFLSIVYDDARSVVYGDGTPRARRFLDIWRHGNAELVAPPVIDEGDAERLAGAVATLYRRAYPETPDCGTDCRSAFDRWGRDASRNPRRLVRAIVDVCDRARPVPDGWDVAVRAP